MDHVLEYIEDSDGKTAFTLSQIKEFSFDKAYAASIDSAAARFPSKDIIFEKSPEGILEAFVLLPHLDGFDTITQSQLNTLLDESNLSVQKWI